MKTIHLKTTQSGVYDTSVGSSVVESILSNSEYKEFPYKIKLVKWTKPMAKEILLPENNLGNRPLIATHVNDLMFTMNTDEWTEESTTAIVVSNEWKLLDGQHRLNAFLQSKLEFLYMVTIIGPESEMARFIDHELPRSPKDTLVMTRRCYVHKNAQKAARGLMEIYGAVCEKDYERNVYHIKNASPHMFVLQGGWPRIGASHPPNFKFQENIMEYFKIIGSVCDVMHKGLRKTSTQDSSDAAINQSINQKLGWASVTMALYDYFTENPEVSEENALLKLGQFFVAFTNVDQIADEKLRMHIAAIRHYLQKDDLFRSESGGNNPGPRVFLLYNGVYSYLKGTYDFDKRSIAQIQQKYFRPRVNMKGQSASISWLKALDAGRLKLDTKVPSGFTKGLMKSSQDFDEGLMAYAK